MNISNNNVQNSKNEISYVESALRRKYFDSSNYNYKDMLEDVEEDIQKEQHNSEILNKKYL